MTLKTAILGGMSLAARRKSRAQPVAPYVDPVQIDVDEPTWDNSGAYTPKASLTEYTGTELITTQDGQIIENLYLPVARIQVRHKNVIIRNCYIEYGPADGRLMIHAHCGVVHNPNYDTRGNLIEYVTFDPINAKASTDVNDANVYGIFGYNMTISRCAIRNVTDAIAPKISSTTGNLTCTIAGNYLETRYLSYDPNQTDGTHNDCVQIPGGSGWIVHGNAMHNPTGTNANGVKGQNIVCTPYQDVISDITVEHNWFYGAYTQVAMWPVSADVGADTPRYTIAGVTLRYNQHLGACTWPILMNTETNNAGPTVADNVAGVGGLIWNNGTTAAGAPISPYVAASH